MDEAFMNLRLPAEADDRLDRFLTEWAQHVRLTTLEEEELYDHIFVMIDDLDYDWWRRLAGGFRFYALNAVPATGFGTNLYSK